MNDEHKLIEKVSAGRLVFANEQILFPLLERKIQETVGSIIGKFQAEGTVELASVATLTAYSNIIEELKAVARDGERAHAIIERNQPRR